MPLARRRLGACFFLAVAALGCATTTGSGVDSAAGGQGGGPRGADAAGVGGAGGRDAAVDVASPADGESAAGGGGGPPSPCATFGGPTRATIYGAGFDRWEGQAVHACLYPTQSFSPSCGDTVVADAQFSVTATVCTGYSWQVTMGSGASAIGCSATISGGPLTPAACWCDSGVGPAPGAAGRPGLGCDAGLGSDARAGDAVEAGDARD